MLVISKELPEGEVSLLPFLTCGQFTEQLPSFSFLLESETGLFSCVGSFKRLQGVVSSSSPDCDRLGFLPFLLYP